MKKAVATKKAATQNKVASQKWDTINIKMRPLIKSRLNGVDVMVRSRW